MERRELAAGVIALLLTLLVLGLVFSEGILFPYVLTTGKVSPFVAQGNGSASVETVSGLILGLSLNATSITQGQGVDITLSMYNPSVSAVNLSTSHGWALPGLSLPPCSQMFPVAFLVMEGNYSEQDLSQGTALPLFRPGVYNCPMIAYVDSYVFQPLSGDAAWYGMCTPGPDCQIVPSPMSVSTTVSGHYVGNLSDSFNSSDYDFQAFGPGVYTAVGGDEWGGLVLLHFVVSQGDSSSSTPSGSYTNVTLSGDGAWAVCAAFRMPCPSNPSFDVKAYGSGNDTICVVVMSFNNVPEALEISSSNSSKYCITPPFPWTTMCP